MKTAKNTCSPSTGGRYRQISGTPWSSQFLRSNSRLSEALSQKTFSFSEVSSWGLTQRPPNGHCEERVRDFGELDPKRDIFIIKSQDLCRREGQETIKARGHGWPRKQYLLDTIELTRSSAHRDCATRPAQGQTTQNPSTERRVPPLTKKPFAADICWEGGNRFSLMESQRVGLSTTSQGSPHAQE